MEEVKAKLKRGAIESKEKPAQLLSTNHANDDEVVERLTCVSQLARSICVAGASNNQKPEKLKFTSAQYISIPEEYKFIGAGDPFC